MKKSELKEIIREAVFEKMTEELCKKGKAYIAKRKRAGEKSSAYLSGRAVKVCKGQMQGEGEELEEMDLQYRKGYKDLTGLYKKIVSTNDIEEKKKLSHVFIDNLKRISREKRYQHKQAIQNGSASMINDLITNLYMKDNRMTSENTLNENEGEVNVFGYQTKHFDVCPGAQSLYKRIVDEDLVEDKDLVTRTAKLHDALFALEKTALENGATELDVEAAQLMADQIMEMAKMMDLESEHQYVQGHVEKVKGAIKGEMNEEIEAKDNTTFKIKLKHLLQKHATNLKRGSDDTEFELTLKHLLDKHVVKGGKEKDD